jgi:hypothetical protein
MSRNDAFRSAADTLDTAMVCAGVGGLYTTWRLLGCGQPPDGIGVFEASARVGGRLFSLSMPGTTGIAKKQPIPYWLRRRRTVAGGRVHQQPDREDSGGRHAGLAGLPRGRR